MTAELVAPQDLTAPEDEWQAVLAPVAATLAGAVSFGRGWHLDRERAHWHRAVRAGADHVSVRLLDDEVLVGPRWVPGTDAGCAGCAELRERTVFDHPLVAALDRPTILPSAPRPLLLELFTAALAHLAEHPLRAGELYAIGPAGTRRHRVPRRVGCPICGSVREPATGLLTFGEEPADPDDPTRGLGGGALLARHALRERLVDPRFGPVRAIMRESHVPMAMSMAVVPDAPAMGHGRALTFGETEPVAVLEAYERLGGFPFDIGVCTELAYTDVADRAVDPATLGRYTGEQLNHPTCRVSRWTPDTPMDWAVGHDLSTGEPRLVPADIGFYQYEYRFRRDRRSARAAGAQGQAHYFHESSSGCAVGSSLPEAALHSLLELAERDAFLLSWHRAQPLPVIADGSITDLTSRAMIELIRSRDFDVHVLVATQDIDLPVVWVLARNRTGGFPAAFSSAGCGAEPAGAIRGALREVAQLVTNELDWTPADVEPMLADPWLVCELEEHVRFSSMPRTLGRTTAVLGGPELTMAEAFPDWPDVLRRASGGDVRGTLRDVRERFAAAGLTEIVLVDQTSREHADAGIAVAKAVVPGIVPMCFGQAQQRLAGLPRLTAALAGTPMAHRRIPYDPHPFP